ncbi:MAG: ThuA domain-containing protein [Planctomycetota bacterium]|jgi:HEAT repeat protein
MTGRIKSLGTGIVIVLCAALVTAVTPAFGAVRIKALIVDGQNNHAWEKTTPVIRKIFDEAGLFEVDVATSPPKGESLEAFKPDFAKYDVVVSNYNGGEWPNETQDAFVQYVRSGGGLVIVHAADNAFAKWKEYNEIIGLGGWGGRNEESGPYVYWKDGQFVRDDSPGRGGTHGNQHAFQVINRDKEHPITAGLPAKWMHAKDELYSLMRGPAKRLTVLATAYHDAAERGSDRHEPVLFIVRYGKGRVFHTVLGHGAYAMSCAGFIGTLQRGTEWAATGEVTQKVPEDFPAADEVRIRDGYEPPKSLEELLAAAAKYEYGKSRRPLSELDDRVRKALDSPDGLKQLENQFIEFLKSDATDAGKQYVCRKLSIIGTEESVPTLAAMLTQEATSEIEPADMARYALERIPAPAAGDALREALAGTGGKVKVGIINSLGQRRDEQAVQELGKLLGDPDKEIVEASLSALSSIGGGEAAKLLRSSEPAVPAELHLLWADAFLRCADRFLADGDVEPAATIYNSLFIRKTEPVQVRIAGLRGIAAASPNRAVRFVIHILKGRDKKLQSAAAALVREIPGDQIVEASARELPNLSVIGQVQVLSALADRGDSSALPAVIEATKSKEADVRIAAYGAVTALGNAGHVNLLAETAGTAKGPEQEAARQGLYRLRGPRVDETIIAAVLTAEPKTQIELIRSIAARNMTAGADVLVATAEHPDTEVRVESLKALRAAAEESYLSALVKLMLGAKGQAERSEAESTVMAVAGKIEGKDKQVEKILAGLPKILQVHSQCSLVRVLGKIGGEKALGLLREYLAQDNAEVQVAVVRALSDWPSAEPMDDLKRIAQNSDDQVQRILALRGFVRLIGLDERPAEEKTGRYKEAMSLAAGADERKLVLSGLGNVRTFSALQLACSYLDDSALQAEAAAAVLKIAEAVQGDYRLQTRAVLVELLAGSQNDSLRQRAQGIIERIDQDLARAEQESKMPDGAIKLIGGDLSAWRQRSGDWQVVGEVAVDAENDKRLAAQPGSGIIVNGPKGKTVDLFSAAEFADVQAHIEFMVPRGSNSGVYFMGRYEVQILDSWGVAELKHGDCGGIYQRWDENRQPKGYEGHPPRVNASLPPGQWQSFDVTFRAPRFDAAGRKIANARFEKVVHNGVVVHEAVEVTGPTRAAAYKDEEPTGPLMVQGDHGPVAYRNTWILPLN